MMKIATPTEFNQAIAKAKWPEPDRMFYGKNGKHSTITYKDLGVEVASRTTIAGKKGAVQVSLMVNTDYLV